MRLNLAVAVTTERVDGRTIYKCATLRGPSCSARDAVLSAALSKLGNAARKSINGWIAEGKPARSAPWLYEPGMKGTVLRLTLTLRDRTIRCKVLLVTIPMAGRIVAMATTAPGLVFELGDAQQLEERAREVLTHWCAGRAKDNDQAALAGLSIEGDAWLESLDVEAEAHVRPKPKAKNILAAMFGQGPVSGSEELSKVGQCLDYMASQFESALGRQALVDEVDQVLRRPDRQGVLIVGPPAVGKTAIVQEAVKRRVLRFQRRRGHKPQTWWISPQRLISGMMYLGQWEQRWLAILREANRRDHILYFDDLVGLYTAGLTRDSRLNAADVLKSYLSEHRVRIVGETTPEELAILRRRDRALADRFHLIHVPTLSPADTLPILLESAYREEIRQRSYFHPSIVPAVIQQQEVLAPNRAFPGKAIELIKSLGDAGQAVTLNDLLFYLHQRTGTNLRLLFGHLGSQTAIADVLGRKVIGQPSAVEAMTRVVSRFTQRLQPSDRPVGVLLFLGPTGVGKTESAKALTELLFDDASRMIRIDMNEITTPLAAEQLVGSFDAPEGRLTSAIRRQPHAVVLLDEIEKAHPDVFDYLLQVLGEGRLTDARGRIVDFRNAIIVLTSNLGSTHQGPPVGFESQSQTELSYRRAAERFFRPEFFNRIDEVIAFAPLTESDIQRIVLIQLRQLLAREGLKRRHVFVRVEQSALEHVVKVGFDKNLGARAVRRALEQEIVQPLGDQLAELTLDSPVLIRVSRSPENLHCQTINMRELVTPESTAKPSLETLLQHAKPMLATFEAQLAAAQLRLKASGSSTQASTNQLEYYSLHERVFRCNQLLRTARHRLSTQSQPKFTPMQRTPAAIKGSTWAGPPSRRMMRDWMAEEDLRDTLEHEEFDPTHLNEPPEVLARHVQQELLLAQAMLESLGQPKRWLIGMEVLSRPENESNQSGATRPSLFNYYLEPEIYFLDCLLECAQTQWQYEVTTIQGLDTFHLVSGVGIASLVRSIAGVYVVEGKLQSRDLCVLRALPVADDMPASEIASWATAQKLLSDSGFMPPPAGQPWDHYTIRGEISSEVIDYASGERLKLGKDWSREANQAQQWADWWIGTLQKSTQLGTPVFFRSRS